MKTLHEVRCLLTTVRARDHDQLAWHLTSLKQDAGRLRFNLICRVALLLWRREQRRSP